VQRPAGQRKPTKQDGYGTPVTHSSAISTVVVAVLLASFADATSAQTNCAALPAEPARTDCYIGLGRVHRGQSDVAATKALAHLDAARYQEMTGARPSKRKPNRSQ
jgi:hypothetical protein